VHGIQKWRPLGQTRRSSLEIVDKDAAANKGAAGEGTSILSMMKEAEAVGTRIASSASRKVRSAPGVNEGSAGQGKRWLLE
jgi:hypothetical protein